MGENEKGIGVINNAFEYFVLFCFLMKSRSVSFPISPILNYIEKIHAISSYK